jgi:hypothetical protein
MKSKSFASRDEQEVAGYGDAMGMIFESFESITPTENHIKLRRECRTSDWHKANWFGWCSTREKHWPNWTKLDHDRNCQFLASA